MAIIRGRDAHEYVPAPRPTPTPPAPAQRRTDAPAPSQDYSWDTPTVSMSDVFTPGYFEPPPPPISGMSLGGLGLSLTPASQWTSQFRPEPEYVPASFESEYDVGGAPAGGGSNDIRGIAESFLGVNKYQYGGFDCSRFTQIVAERAGIKIPRATGTQIPFFQKNNLWSKTLQNARVGDLVYLRSSASGSGRHVGVYIGNGRMIDNSGRGKPIAVRRVDPKRLMGVGHLSAYQRGDADPSYPLEAYGVNRGEDADRKGPAMYGLQEPMAKALRDANESMNSAGLGRFGVTSGYRSMKEQAELKAKQPDMSSDPGHSVHHLGLAADLRLTQPQEKWLKKNAYRFGLKTFDSEGWHVQLDPHNWKGF